VSRGQLGELDQNESARNVLYILDLVNDMIGNEFACSREVGDGLWESVRARVFKVESGKMLKIRNAPHLGLGGMRRPETTLTAFPDRPLHIFTWN
jgi:hypothetical protein